MFSLLDLLYALVLLVLFIFVVFAAWGIAKILSKYSRNAVVTFLNTFFPGRYVCYYPSREVIKNDQKAKALLDISHHGYVDNKYEDFYEKLTEDHFPLPTLINWTRTIVEDLLESLNPVTQVDNWVQYFKSPEYARLKLHPDYIDFGEHEMAYLWGAVYYWLRSSDSSSNFDDLLAHIEEIACKKKYARPYFLFFKVQAGDSVGLEAVSSVSQPKGCLTAEQTALLWLAIAKLTEGEVKNKKKLAPAISQVAGVGKGSIEQKLCGTFRDEDKDALIKIFGELMPNLAEKIRHIEKSNPLP
jgi:hypothetical protein